MHAYTHTGVHVQSVVSNSVTSWTCSLPGSSVHGIFQARILNWVAISLSKVSSWVKDQTWVSYIVGRFFTTVLPGKLYICINIHIYIYTHTYIHISFHKFIHLTSISWTPSTCQTLYWEYRAEQEMVSFLMDFTTCGEDCRKAPVTM